MCLFKFHEKKNILHQQNIERNLCLIQKYLWLIKRHLCVIGKYLCLIKHNSLLLQNQFSHLESFQSVQKIYRLSTQCRQHLDFQRTLRLSENNQNILKLFRRSGKIFHNLQDTLLTFQKRGVPRSLLTFWKLWSRKLFILYGNSKAAIWKLFRTSQHFYTVW